MATQATGRPLGAALADLAGGLELDALPRPVVDAARRSLIDSVGVMLAGAAEDEVRAMAGELTARAGSEEATLLGLAERADAVTAALVNGTAGVWHDLDGGNRWLGGHPAAHAVPAALAVAEREHASGRALLEATVAGYEVAAAVGAAVKLRPGMHPHGTWPVVGAAAAAARLMYPGDAELLREAIQIASALPLATSFEAAFEGATIRNVFAGMGAANGVLAAELAGAGMTGQADGIEDVYGSVAGVDFDASLVPPPGTWMILRGYQKLHACARYLHPALDALEAALASDDVDPAAIERIDVRTYPFAASMDDPRPSNPLAARFSLPFALATALVADHTGVDAFADPALSDEATLALSAKVKVTSVPEMDAGLPHERPAAVSVRMRDGRVLEGAVRQARGEPDGDDPVLDAQVDEKFLGLAARVLAPDGARRLLDALRAVESVDDVAALTAMARP